MLLFVSLSLSFCFFDSCFLLSFVLLASFVLFVFVVCLFLQLLVLAITCISSGLGKIVAVNLFTFQHPGLLANHVCNTCGNFRPEEQNSNQVPKYLQERELLGWREVLTNVTSSQK